MGIEAAQLVLVAGIVVMLAAGQRWLPKAHLPARLSSFAREIPATAIGSLGVFWCLERAAAWLFP